MASLADFDDAFDTIYTGGDITPEQFAALPAPWLPCGFFTIGFPDGSHKTYRVRLERFGAFRGRRTLAVLIGPDNTSDYETIGFVEEKGFAIWRGKRVGRTVEYAVKLWTLARNIEIPGHSLRVSKRCRLCMRELTTPESIDLELGATCARKLGIR